MEICPLIRTKLAPPRLGSLRVARTALLAQLEERQERCATLVLGPIGSGKTTLAAQWRQHLIMRGCDVAWYNVGADDNETQWAAYLVASLQQAGVDIGPALAQAMLRGEAESGQRFVALITNQLFAHSQPIYLFIEDMHLLRSRAPLEAIERLLDNAPPNFHIVMTARGMPSMDFSALRRKGQLLEIDFAQLRFSATEQLAFLSDLGVAGLTSGQASRLYALTEGWAAGTQLAAWSLKKGIDFETTFTRLTRLAVPLGDEGLTDYFDNALSGIVEPRQLDLLIRMSACRRLNRELCYVICEDPGAGKLLETLGKQNFFLLPIESDDVQPWYRFHRIFASFLRQKLRALPPEELARINRRVSVWFEACGLYVEAIRHARYAGDMARQVDLMTAAARPMIYAGQFIELARWTAEIPAQALHERIELMLCLGWAQICSWRLGAFNTTLDAIEIHPEAGDPKIDFEVRLLRAISMLMRDETEHLLPLIEPFIASPPPTDRFNILMLGSIASMALVKAGQYDRARDVAADCQATLRQQHGARLRPYLDTIPGISLLLQGDFIQARAILHRLMCDIEREGTMAETSAAHVAGYLAEVHWQLDDVDAVEDCLETYAETVALFGIPDYTLHALRATARLHFSRGDLARALEALDGLERLAQDEGWDRLAAWSLAERVRMLGANVGGITAMREALRRLKRLASRYAGDIKGINCEIHLAAASGEVDAAVAEFDWPRVKQLALSLAEVFSQRSNLYLAARMRLLAAVACSRMADSGAALALALPLVSIANQHGMLRLFAEETDGGAALVPELLALPTLTRDDRAFLERQAQRQAHTPASLPRSATEGAGEGGKDLLSQREREIIQLLSKALSRKTIARTANVSPGTIKWHLKNIYGKLGAVSREDAVAKARELKFIA